MARFSKGSTRQSLGSYAEPCLIAFRVAQTPKIIRKAGDTATTKIHSRGKNGRIYFSLSEVLLEIVARVRFISFAEFH